jgi:hypothetical protein
VPRLVVLKNEKVVVKVAVIEMPSEQPTLRKSCKGNELASAEKVGAEVFGDDDPDRLTTTILAG